MELWIESQKKVTSQYYSYKTKKERDAHIEQMESEGWECVNQTTGVKGNSIIEAEFELVEEIRYKDFTDEQ
ncbi:hypothetical protein [Zhenhengia yiwuensis]|uniref:Uncharacterized protein n=1 Tax=Zhenhengia yiwuensis TaxID=2763666 RepID=A0A926ENX2_9FIRM|nr:hypothetical protein [Zhenhengia yiwuensis]MBC8581537.1 hypothetical protein [Zhenhengia yiwuensis]MBS5315937.1 hypothetical protein [Clostridiales bacterium]